MVQALGQRQAQIEMLQNGFYQNEMVNQQVAANRMSQL